jgi:chemotaxis response regulator CheB
VFRGRSIWILSGFRGLQAVQMCNQRRGVIRSVVGRLVLGTKTRVLLVDDAVVVRKSTVASHCTRPLLEMAATAVNGRIGLAKFIASKPNNVLLDDEMPEMDGLETVRELREINDRVPIIMFSMFSSLTERGAAVTLPCLNCVD